MLETIYEKISMAISIFVGFAFGKWHYSLSILLALMCMDYITGVVRAWKTQSLNSTIARHGIISKFLCFIPIILSNLVDNLLSLEGTTLTICIMFYVFSEALSICENLAQAGVPLPKQLIDVLEKVSKTNEDIVIDPKKDKNVKDLNKKDNK